MKNQAGPGGAVWSDVGTILPWNIYMNYGDYELLKQNYPMMMDYVNSLIKKDKEQGNYNLILEGFTYGDWLALDGESEFDRLGGTDNGFIMSVYYYHSVELLTLAAKELGRYYQLANKHIKNDKLINGDYYNRLVFTIKKFYPQKYKRIIQ